MLQLLNKDKITFKPSIVNIMPLKVIANKRQASGTNFLGVLPVKSNSNNYSSLSVNHFKYAHPDNFRGMKKKSLKLMKNNMQK